MDEPNDRKLEKCKVLNNTQIENFVLNKTFTRHSKTFKTRSNLDDFKLSIQDAKKILQIKPFIEAVHFVVSRFICFGVRHLYWLFLLVYFRPENE